MKKGYFIALLILLSTLFLYSQPPQVKGQSFCGNFDPESCPSPECAVITKKLTVIRCGNEVRELKICVDVTESCSYHDPESCPSPDCEIVYETVPKGFLGCEGTEQVPVCTKATVNHTGFCFPETIQDIFEGIAPIGENTSEGEIIDENLVDLSNLPTRVHADYFYEQEPTTDWEFNIENLGTQVIVPRFISQSNWGESTIEPRDSNLSSENCNFYLFDFQREGGAVLSYTLPLMEQTERDGITYCTYSLDSIADELEQNLNRFGGKPIDSICPELQKGKELGEGTECPETAECNITIIEGPQELFGFETIKDNCGKMRISETNSGFSFSEETASAKEQHFFDRCSEFFSQCDNGIDDDGDGKIDYPDDPGCISEFGNEGEIRFGPCMELYHGTNNPAEDRVNVIFLSYGYSHISNVIADVKYQVNQLLETEPFNSYKDKFNFWVVGEMGNIENCGDVLSVPFVEESKMLICPTTPADICPVLSNRFINVLVDDQSNSLDYTSRAFPGSGTTLLYKSDFESTLFTHEFGHSFGQLFDEYIEVRVFPEFFEEFPNLFPFEGPNCYSTIEDTTYWQCEQRSPWKDQFGNGCGEQGVIDCVKELDCRYDANGDGKFTKEDVTEVTRMVRGEVPLRDCMFEDRLVPVVDFNNDGHIDHKEYSAIKVAIDSGVGCFDPLDPDCIYEVGCYEGCSSFQHGAFRSTPCSIMRHPIYCPKFGPVSEKVIEDRILQFS